MGYWFHILLNSCNLQKEILVCVGVYLLDCHMLQVKSLVFLLALVLVLRLLYLVSFSRCSVLVVILLVLRCVFIVLAVVLYYSSSFVALLFLLVLLIFSLCSCSSLILYLFLFFFIWYLVLVLDFLVFLILLFCILLLVYLVSPSSCILLVLFYLAVVEVHLSLVLVYSSWLLCLFLSYFVAVLVLLIVFLSLILHLQSHQNTAILGGMKKTTKTYKTTKSVVNMEEVWRKPFSGHEENHYKTYQNMKEGYLVMWMQQGHNWYFGETA